MCSQVERNINGKLMVMTKLKLVRHKDTGVVHPGRNGLTTVLSKHMQD